MKSLKEISNEELLEELANQISNYLWKKPDTIEEAEAEVLERMKPPDWTKLKEQFKEWFGDNPRHATYHQVFYFLTNQKE